MSLTEGKTVIHAWGKVTADSLIDEAQKMYKDFSDMGEMELTRQVSLRKTYETKDFVTYTMEYYSYDGGAHGMSTTEGATFRKSDGRKFGWDIFSLKGRNELQDLIKAGLKSYFKISSDEDLKNNLLEGNIFYIPLPTSVPYFTKEGVHFVYQPYEIACYAAGMPSFTIPYSQIKGKLTYTTSRMIP